MLCEEKNSIAKLTVKDLCERAKISKSTFYLHYQDIEAIFESVGEKFLITFDQILGETENADYFIFMNKLLAELNDSSEIIKIGLKYDRPYGSYINGIKSKLVRIVGQTSVQKKYT